MLQKYTRANGSVGYKLVEFGQSKTQQACKDECDINKIMKKFEHTGKLPDMIKSNAQYGDFSNVPTYQEACDVVFKAQEQFMSLSAQSRKRFHNDPAEMLDFCSKEENREEMYKLGLAVRPVVTPQVQEAPQPEGAPQNA